MHGRAGRAVTICTGAFGAIVAALSVPTRQPLAHLDHIAYLETVRQMRGGVEFHDAYVRGMASIDANVDSLRTFREPLAFEVWASLPDAWLQPAFFAVVVFGSVLASLQIVRHPFAALAVGLWLAVAGALGGVDAWLLTELWTVPLVLAACGAWLRGRDVEAAMWATSAVLVRETAVVLLVGFALSAFRAKRSLPTWAVAVTVCAGGLLLHWRGAAPHLYESPDLGPAARLWGDGGLHSVVAMTSFLVVPGAVGIAVWLTGSVLLWRSPLRPAIGLALMPLFGVAMFRPYWGFLAMPLCLLMLGGVRRLDEPTMRRIDVRGPARHDSDVVRGRTTEPAPWPSKPEAPAPA